MENNICVTKDGQKIRLSKIGDIHLVNRIKYFKRMLDDMPGDMYYDGDSDAAGDAVESENAHNEALAEDIKEHIRAMEEEVKKRDNRMSSQAKQIKEEN